MSIVSWSVVFKRVLGPSGGFVKGFVLFTVEAGLVASTFQFHLQSTHVVAIIPKHGVCIVHCAGYFAGPGTRGSHATQMSGDLTGEVQLPTIPSECSQGAKVTSRV